eukprot:6632941-Pyramimonas_sp.AAC.1
MSLPPTEWAPFDSQKLQEVPIAKRDRQMQQIGSTNLASARHALARGRLYKNACPSTVRVLHSAARR